VFLLSGRTAGPRKGARWLAVAAVDTGVILPRSAD
jgi:hypothetical protein